MYFFAVPVVPLDGLADVHALQLGHVPEVCALELLQPPVVLLVSEVHLLLPVFPLQAVDLQRDRAAYASSAGPLITTL